VRKITIQPFFEPHILARLVLFDAATLEIGPPSYLLLEFIWANAACISVRRCSADGSQ
jgi:hypothetical protein